VDQGNDGSSNKIIRESNKGKNKEVVKMIEEMKKAGVRNLRGDK